MAARSAVGLDIGTSGVRGAQVSLGKGPAVLERFGQVALPPGAVVDGEVVDVAVVADAIKRLWAETKFSTRKVVLGVANQKVVVRQVDLPWLPAHELRASLGYQVADLIPMPVETALLDFHALEEFHADSGARMLRVLLVAASRTMVGAAVEATTRAGLRPVSVDLTPFAVLRALAPLDELGLQRPEAEALVDVGANVTNIVVHEGGVPRFVRILLMGGADVTDALAERLGVPFEQAEMIKQQGALASAGEVPGDSPAGRVLEQTGAALVEEVRGSLDYYLAQPGAARLSRLVLSGGGARLGGLPERLASATRLPVEPGSPLSTMTVGRTGLTDAQLSYIAPLVGVPVGLALGVAS